MTTTTDFLKELSDFAIDRSIESKEIVKAAGVHLETYRRARRGGNLSGSTIDRIKKAMEEWA